jgi:hypothetical protein
MGVLLARWSKATCLSGPSNQMSKNCNSFEFPRAKSAQLHRKSPLRSDSDGWPRVCTSVFAFVSRVCNSFPSFHDHPEAAACNMHALREPSSRPLSSEEELSGARLKKKLRQTAGNGLSSRNKLGKMASQRRARLADQCVCSVGMMGEKCVPKTNPVQKSNGRSKFPGIVFRGTISLRSA